MKDKIFMILLGIIAVNLTIQTVKDVGIFPTAYAQNVVQKVAICDIYGVDCADISTKVVNGRFVYALPINNVSGSQ